MYTMVGIMHSEYVVVLNFRVALIYPVVIRQASVIHVHQVRTSNESVYGTR